MKKSVKVGGPCRNYLKGGRCSDEKGRDHCFNCARHLDPSALRCPKGCGDHGDEHDEKVSNADQDAE